MVWYGMIIWNAAITFINKTPLNKTKENHYQAVLHNHDICGNLFHPEQLPTERFLHQQLNQMDEEHVVHICWLTMDALDLQQLMQNIEH